jgi:hypothetical protein
MPELENRTLYRFFDLVVASNVDLDGTHASAGAVDCVFTVHDTPMVVPESCMWSVIYETPSPWLSVADHCGSTLIRIHEMAEFRVAPGGSEVDCHPLVDLPVESVRHLFVDQILPLMLASRGKTVLHASAVSTPRGAVAFVGDTGFGKSTLAASFGAAGQPTLTDDCLLASEVDGVWMGHPSGGELHLCPDIVESFFGAGDHTAPVAHYTDKCCVRLPRREPGSEARAEPLIAVYALTDPGDATDPDHVTIRRASRRSAFRCLINNAFRADFSRARARHELETLIRLAGAVPVSTLSYRRAVEMLPVVRQAVLDDVRSGGVTS